MLYPVTHCQWLLFVSGVNLAAGSFALAWNAFVLLWSYSAFMSGELHEKNLRTRVCALAGGILPMLFSIPFWYAGAEIAKLSISNSLTHQNLKITRQSFYLTKELIFLRTEDNVAEFDDITALKDDKRAKKQIKGRTSDLSKAEVRLWVVTTTFQTLLL